MSGYAQGLSYALQSALPHISALGYLARCYACPRPYGGYGALLIGHLSLSGKLLDEANAFFHQGNQP